MPSVSENVKVLNGRGSVIQYSSGRSVGKFAYREWNKETRSYKVKHLYEAKTLEEAIAMAPDAAISLREVKEDKPIAQSFDPLNLIEREEQLVRKKERLLREEKKKESPKITIEKAMSDWLRQQEKRFMVENLVKRVSLINSIAVVT